MPYKDREEAKKKKREYYAAHKDEINAERKEKYKTNKDAVKAYQVTHAETIKKARHTYHTNHKELCNARTKAWHDAHKEEEKAYRLAHIEEDALRAKNKQILLRNEILTAYGNKCACCGETEPNFLTVDHINGGGNKHKKEIGGNFYRWLKTNNFPPGFQILCYNCNCAKGHYGICPHQLKKEM